MRFALPSRNGIHRITVRNIPFANYDVYLYHSSNGGPNRTARYQANGIDLYTRNLDPANTFNGFVNAQYPTLAEAALASGNPAGNYIRWEGLSGILSIQATDTSSSYVQTLPVPAPRMLFYRVRRF